MTGRTAPWRGVARARHPAPRARARPGRVLAALDAAASRTCVLIEGPADADPLLPLAARPGHAPAGRAAGLRRRTTPRRRRVLAVRGVLAGVAGAALGAPSTRCRCAFCDLPAGHAAGRRGRATAGGRRRPADAGARRTDGGRRRRAAIARPARPAARRWPQAAGYDDPERWWDDVVESRLDGAAAVRRDDRGDGRAAGPAAGRAADAAAARGPPRGVHAPGAARRARRQADGRVAVVCGAWHAPALAGKLPPAAADAALLRGAAEAQGRADLGAVDALPAGRRRPATAPGSTSPGWYHHLFTAPDQRSPAG